MISYLTDVKELGIWDVYQGVHDKTNKLMEIVESLATVAVT